jgi:nitroreductase
MDVIKAILTRRSIRRYTSEPVTEAEVEKLLAAAMAAPSAGNQQPWHFVVIRERDTLNAVPEFHPHAGMLREASVAILVCGDVTLQKHEGYWVQDCSAATQNLLLAAHALGLGAVWLGIHPRPEREEGIRKLLGLPTNVVPLALISVGRPAEEKEPAGRYDSERVHRERW